MRSRCSAQHHHDVGVLDAFAHVVKHARAPVSAPAGISVGGPIRRTLAPSRLSSATLERATRECSTSPQMAIGEPFDLAEPAADGESVEQRLGGVLVLAVAGIDHGAIDLARQQRRRPGCAVAHNKQIGAHGVQGGGGVDQGFALGHARGSSPTC